MQVDTLESINQIIGNSKEMLLLGDFNCKEVKWESYECEGDENNRGNKILKLAMDNTMVQWVKKATRHREENEPSRLDLVLTKEINLIDDIKYICPIG